MARPRRLLLLLGAGAALITARGVAASTVAANVVVARGGGDTSSCGQPGADQPLCDDPSVQTDADHGSQLQETREVDPSPYQSGDIVELYNPSSSSIQIVFPSIVKSRNSEGGYTVAKTTDGKEVKDIPEKFLHMYVPYGAGDEALCNIGEFKPARPIVVRCTVLGYRPAASRGAMVLQSKYEVRVHATKANEEYVTELPVWKMQRRYLATATA